MLASVFTLSGFIVCALAVSLVGGEPTDDKPTDEPTDKPCEVIKYSPDAFNDHCGSESWVYIQMYYETAAVESTPIQLCLRNMDQPMHSEKLEYQRANASDSLDDVESSLESGPCLIYLLPKLIHLTGCRFRRYAPFAALSTMSTPNHFQNVQCTWRFKN
ncbi:hypothetical protein O0I10_009759 [Lichtheimia ornata]|uniref:Salivary lipocalin n=1 Tax=Lichtheimia ornata TaxID=688661 RepID=A0AAD7XYF3_9FUNG|nr:uncharacterized protein O0I10_009759 [Lichtheimia ornata]KAJ8654577.1 hypothetical protein O0I10_009759 [Lichtheimia ornata]